MSGTTRGALLGLAIAVSKVSLLVTRGKTLVSRKIPSILHIAQGCCICATHLGDKKRDLLQGLATVVAERIKDATLNSSRSLVHGGGLQETLERGPPTSPVPSQRLVPRLLRISAGCSHQVHLILRREQGSSFKKTGNIARK
jgi:hypothetical protein